MGKRPNNEMKFDSGKARPSLVPLIPLKQIEEIFEFGAQKYAKNSWRDPDREAVEWSRTYDSILRHLHAWYAREDLDPESGLTHLAHAAAQMMILMEHTTTGEGEDDRYENGK